MQIRTCSAIEKKIDNWLADCMNKSLKAIGIGRYTLSIYFLRIQHHKLHINKSLSSI